MRPVQMDPQVLMHLAAEIQLAQCAKHPAKFRSVSYFACTYYMCVFRVQNTFVVMLPSAAVV